MDRNMSYENLIKTGYSGWGSTTFDDVQNLVKALDPGYATSIANQVGGGALRLQSLEMTLKILTYRENSFALWQKIPKQKGFSTVEEYTQVISPGSNVGSHAPGFIPAGVLPSESEANYQRKYGLVKYLGTTRRVTVQQTFVNNMVPDVVALENQMGTLWILRNLEWGLYNGYSKGKNGAEYIQFDGLERVVRDYNSTVGNKNIIDLRNNILTPDIINDSVSILLENYAIPSHLLLPYKVLGQFVKDFLEKQRVFLPSQTGAYTAGIAIDNYVTHGGTVSLLPDIFNQATPNPPALATSSNSPEVSGNSITAAAGTTDVSWEGTVTGGSTTIFYAVTASNQYGESAPVFVDYAVATGNENKSAVLSGLSAAFNNLTTEKEPHQIHIYRAPVGVDASDHNVSKYFKIDTVTYGTTTFEDKVETIPNTFTAYALQMDESVIAFKQLAPLMKMDLAIIDPSIRWMLLLFGTLLVYQPTKIVMIKNIKNV